MSAPHLRPGMAASADGLRRRGGVSPTAAEAGGGSNAAIGAAGDDGSRRGGNALVHEGSGDGAGFGHFDDTFEAAAAMGLAPPSHGLTRSQTQHHNTSGGRPASDDASDSTPSLRRAQSAPYPGRGDDDDDEGGLASGFLKSQSSLNLVSMGASV